MVFAHWHASNKLIVCFYFCVTFGDNAIYPVALCLSSLYVVWYSVFTSARQRLAVQFLRFLTRFGQYFPSSELLNYYSEEFNPVGITLCKLILHFFFLQFYFCIQVFCLVYFSVESHTHSLRHSLALLSTMILPVHSNRWRSLSVASTYIP